MSRMLVWYASVVVQYRRRRSSAPIYGIWNTEYGNTEQKSIVTALNITHFNSSIQLFTYSRTDGHGSYNRFLTVHSKSHECHPPHHEHPGKVIPLHLLAALGDSFGLCGVFCTF